MHARFTLAATLLLGFSPCGRVDDERPESVGSFTIESTLVTNGCGQGGYAIPAVSELVATVRGYPGNAAQFQWSGQAAAASGFATTNGVYSFETTSTTTAIAADPSIFYPGCQLAERTAMTFTLSPLPSPAADAGTDGVDAGTTATTLTGQISIDVVPTAGSDCSPLLGANGGPWLAIPCQAKINLAGTRKD